MNRPAGEHPYEPHRPWSAYPPAPGYPPRPPYPQPVQQREPTYLPPLQPPEPPAAPRHSGRRPGRLWYIIAVALLVPGWMCFLVWRSAGQPYAKESYAVGTVVDRGSPAEAAGATWRFGSIAPASPSTGSPKGPPPRGATLMRAYIDVTPHTTAAAKNIVGCTFAAQDDRGRVWDASSDYVDTGAAVPEGCVPPSFAGRYIPAGHTQKVGATFLVPTDAARSLRPMVKPTAQGSYVLFR